MEMAVRAAVMLPVTIACLLHGKESRRVGITTAGNPALCSCRSEMTRMWGFDVQQLWGMLGVIVCGVNPAPMGLVVA